MIKNKIEFSDARSLLNRKAFNLDRITSAHTRSLSNEIKS